MRPRALVLLGLLLFMIAAPFVSPAAAQQGTSDHEDEPIHLALILHQHQPYYRNVATDFYELPWVRVHAIHEYVDSPGILSMYPQTNVTYNIVPSLIEQIEDYADPSTLDDHTQYATMSWPVDEGGHPIEFPSNLTQRQKWDMQGEYFRIQPWVYDVPTNDSTYGWMANASATFGRLFDAWQDDDRSILDENGSFHVQDMIDLATVFHLFQLSAPHVQGEFSHLEWAEGAPHRNATVIALFEQGGPYTVEDWRTVLDYQRSQMLNVMPMYAALEARGQVELTTTPRYHPIMPLLAMDGWTMEDGLEVDKDSWIEDVDWQIREGLDLFENATGMRPSGMWPSEQAVSHDVVAPMVQNGVRWAVSDQLVLGASRLEGGASPNHNSLVEVAQPYVVETSSGNLTMFFRHQELSDRIGFAYGDMDPVDAVDDFIEGVEDFREAVLSSGRNPSDHVVTVALDGENWLFMSGFGYTDNGRAFMHELFERLSNTSTIRTTTPSAFLEAHGTDDLPRLEHLATGSWINGALQRWAGEPEETLNWRRLDRARSLVIEVEAQQPTHPGLPAARLALMAAQGSDWFWWYGADQDSGDDLGFDTLFKNHLATIYQSLDRPLPPDLGALTHVISQPQALTSGQVEPLIDGRVFAGEWEDAEVHAATADGGFVDVSHIRIGHDAGGIHLRVDLDNPEALLDGVTDDGTPHLQLYLMEPNAVDTNIVGANYRSYYGGQDLGFPARTMLWFDLGNAQDGFVPYNTFEAQGDERWSLRSRSDAVVSINETIELSLGWTDLGLEPLDVTRLRVVSSMYQLRGQGRGVDLEVAPDHAVEIQMPDLETWLTVFEIDDPIGDETGDGDYVYPEAGDFAPGAGLFDITHVRLEQSAWNARFTFTMAEVTNGWGMMNGYSHANLQVYVDQGPSAHGETALFDGLRAEVPDAWAWEAAFMAIGEAAPTYARQSGSDVRINSGIESTGNAEENTITVTVSKDLIGGDLANYRYLIVVASQDGYGTGKVRQVDDVATKWTAGGGASRGLNNQWYHPNIFDIVLPQSADQPSMLGSYDASEGAYAQLSGFEVPGVPQQVYGLSVSEVSGDAALLQWSSATGGPMVITTETIEDRHVSGPHDMDGTSHRILLENLTPGEEHMVQVETDGVIARLNFTTPTSLDRSPPTILAPTMELDDDLGLILGFYTTERSSTTVRLCPTSGGAECRVTLGDAFPVRRVHRMIVEPTEREHRITLEVRDASGNLAELTLGTIGTPDQVEGPDSQNGSSGGTDQSLTDPSQERGLPSPMGGLSTLVVLAAAALMSHVPRARSRCSESPDMN